MTKAKGSITVSRIGHGEEGHIEIRLREERSGLEFVSFSMELADFASALTGLAYVSGVLDFRGLNLLGMKAENKTELVPCKPYGDKEAKYAALKEFEVDGWHARSGDIDNHHNYISEKGVKVVFFRHTGTPFCGVSK